MESNNCGFFLAAILAVFFSALAFNLVFYDLPIGWDGFYHLRVLGLSQEQQKLVPHDPVSAGGRLQTYPPGHYALLLPLKLLTGARAEAIGRLISSVMGVLTVIAIFVLSRRIFPDAAAALLSVLFFSTSPEVLGSFLSFAMPQATGHFLIVSGLFAFLYVPAIFPLVALSLSATHAISTIVLAIYLIVFGISGRAGPKKIALYLAMLFLFVVVWGAAFPSYSVPTWGAPMKLRDYVGAMGPLQTLIFVLFSFSAINRFSLAAAAMLLLTRGPLVPVRFIYHAILPMSLSATDFFRRNVLPGLPRPAGPLVLVAFLSAFLLVGAAKYGNYAGPQIDRQDVDALKWISLNTAGNSTVMGYKDLSAIWLLYYSERPTVLDGYSEGVTKPYERMSDEYLAYSVKNMTEAKRIFSKYGVRYLFFNSLEEGIYREKFNMTKFYALPILANNGYAKVARVG